jgi:hypothetical protein
VRSLLIKHGLQDYKCEVLKDYRIILFPNKGKAYKEWHEIALKKRFYISQVMEKNEKLNEGADIADFLIS